MGKALTIGSKFGKLTVISAADRPTGVKNHKTYYLCKCECGQEKIIIGTDLTNKRGGTKSCGCIRSENLVGKNMENYQ
jgi:hypothetical protein